LLALIGHVQSRLVVDVPQPGLVRFSISSTSSLSEMGAVLFMEILLHPVTMIDRRNRLQNPCAKPQN
jgi:hypothetical protein